MKLYVSDMVTALGDPNVHESHAGMAEESAPFLRSLGF